MNRRPRVWLGEAFRWYLTKAGHPFKNYIVGHYWSWFCKPRVWIVYDGSATISVCLADYLQEQIFLHGYYERPLIEWLERTLRPTDVFWDVGANIGAVTLVAARLCRRVVAFEPDPRSLELLTRHLRVNGIDNVTVIPMALGDEAGTARLHQAATRNTGMTSLIEGRADVAGIVEVPVLRADDLLADRPELAPDVVKIDVEGAEHLVIGGAPDLLRGGRVRALVFEDRTDAHGAPANDALVSGLKRAALDIHRLGPSADGLEDGMCNFLATPRSLAWVG